MKTILRTGFAVALCAAAAACSSPAPAPAPDAAPAAAPAPAPTAFDGIYRGRLVRVRMPQMSRTCVGTQNVILRIQNGTLTYTRSKKAMFTSEVAADGSFSATMGDETLKGTVADKTITGQLDGPKCGHTLSAKLK